MRNFKSIIFILCIAAAAFGIAGIVNAGTHNPDAVVGYWMTGEGKAKIHVYKYKDKYFGKIIWLKNPNDEHGKPKVDKNNPNEKHRSRPILGLLLLRDFEYDGGNVWDEGNIYDPESGNDYSCEMTLLNANTLKVRGYIGISLIGRTQTWTRTK